MAVLKDRLNKMNMEKGKVKVLDYVPTYNLMYLCEIIGAM